MSNVIPIRSGIQDTTAASAYDELQAMLIDGGPMMVDAMLGLFAAEIEFAGISIPTLYDLERAHNILGDLIILARRNAGLL